jgi:hypothetical protein
VRHAVGDRWQVDETYVFVSARRDAKAARRFFDQAINATKVTPTEVTTDQAPAYPAMLGELPPATWHRTDQYANNGIEGDHGRLKARLQAMRGLKQDRSIRVIIAGYALIQNVRRGHYELAVEEPANRRVAVAVDELALVICSPEEATASARPRGNATAPSGHARSRCNSASGSCSPVMHRDGPCHPAHGVYSHWRTIVDDPSGVGSHGLAGRSGQPAA